ncbi:hypothetical protein MED222_05990 [Vibrio sp. MED222]|nr:hypothetical protein MED222_05990 [Vibrio sp. MED222]
MTKANKYFKCFIFSIIQQHPLRT